jgi:hypothetical protein
MIPKQALERQRVLRQAERVRDFVDSVLSSNAGNGDHEITPAELVALRERIDLALAEADEGRDVDEAHPPTAYVPRNVTLANIQSLAVIS